MYLNAPRLCNKFTLFYILWTCTHMPAPFSFAADFSFFFTFSLQIENAKQLTRLTLNFEIVSGFGVCVFFKFLHSFVFFFSLNTTSQCLLRLPSKYVYSGNRLQHIHFKIRHKWFHSLSTFCLLMIVWKKTHTHTFICLFVFHLLLLLLVFNFTSE